MLSDSLATVILSTLSGALAHRIAVTMMSRQKKGKLTASQELQDVTARMEHLLAQISELKAIINDLCRRAGQR